LTLLLDAGVWVASGTAEDRYHLEASSLVRERQDVLAALDLTLYEVANALGVKHGQPRNAERLSRLIVRCCGGGRMATVDSELVGAAIDVAGRHRISAYDAAYVAVAQRRGWQLVSTDIRDLVSKGLAVTPDAADYP
jgi:predicted nucleic acid-binding protein